MYFKSLLKGSMVEVEVKKEPSLFPMLEDSIEIPFDQVAVDS